MRKLFLPALALVACAGGQRSHNASGQPVLSIVGRVDHGPYTFSADDLHKVPRRSLRALPPGADAPAKFEGVAVAQLFADGIDLKRGVDTAVFHGHEGYAVPVPLSAVRQLRPILADSVDGAPIASWRTDAAPLELAWPNVEQPGIDTDPRMRWWWVSGVTRVEMQNWTATYARALRVPPGSSDDARLGADAFAVQCMACHKLRGVGGSRGPDVTSAAKRDPAALAASMRDHLHKYAPPGPETPSAAVQQIAEFLREIEVSGNRPDDEPPPPPEQQGPPPRRPGY